jgi:hypothetical protein
MNNCQSEGGCFRAVPPQIGLEAGIGFYKYPDARTVNAGDMWVAGSNCWVSGDSFTIGTNGVGECLNISNTGVVDVPYYITTQEVMVDTLRARTTEFINIDDNVVITGSLTVNGILESGATVVYNPYWIASKVSFNGSIKSNSGRYNITNINKLSGDTGYDITFPSHPLGANAIVMLCANEYTVFYRSQTATSIRIYTRTPTNTPGNNTDYDFHLAILA